MPETENPNEKFVNIFETSEHDAETEAELIRGLLESSGIEAMIVRQNVQELPTGTVAVRVMASQADEARAILAESQRGNDSESS